jgi:hypothetical protein
MRFVQTRLQTRALIGRRAPPSRVNMRNSVHVLFNDVRTRPVIHLS